MNKDLPTPRKTQEEITKQWGSIKESAENLQDLEKEQEEYFKTVTLKLEDVTRLEVIDHTKPVDKGGGRVYVNWDKKLKFELNFQDEGKTLKVFITKRDE